MRRREFLGTVAAGMAVVAVPVVAFERKHVYTVKRFLERLKWPQSHLGCSLRTFGPRMKGKWLQEESATCIFDFCPDAKVITDWVEPYVYMTAIHDGVAYQSRWTMLDEKPVSTKPRTLIFAPSDRHDEAMAAIKADQNPKV
jgi:hypothetical protein